MSQDQLEVHKDRTGKLPVYRIALELMPSEPCSLKVMLGEPELIPNNWKSRVATRVCTTYSFTMRDSCGYFWYSKIEAESILRVIHEVWQSN